MKTVEKKRVQRCNYTPVEVNTYPHLNIIYINNVVTVVTFVIYNFFFAQKFAQMTTGWLSEGVSSSSPD